MMFLTEKIMLEPVPFAMILQMGSFPVQSVHHTEMMRSIWHHSTVVRRGLIYNKTFFDENNLEVPKTWDEFFCTW